MDYADDWPTRTRQRRLSRNYPPSTYPNLYGDVALWHDCDYTAQPITYKRR